MQLQSSSVAFMKIYNIEVATNNLPLPEQQLIDEFLNSLKLPILSTFHKEDLARPFILTEFK